MRVDSTDWRPACSLNLLKERAEAYRKLRQFFAEYQVLEVDTPLLMPTTGTDPHLDAIECKVNSCIGFLQTSPEFAMKRLIAAGSGDVYQLGKAFRADEKGQYHNPEFTLLEWYRLGFELQDMIDEVATCVAMLGLKGPIEQYDYQSLFEQYLGVNPHTTSVDQLRTLINNPSIETDDFDTTTILQWLFSTTIEPHLGRSGPCFVTHYPKAQAALAKTTEKNGHCVAERFELYFKGIELANGYHELTVAKEQRQRMELDNIERLRLGKPVRALDGQLLGALACGLPDCSGVAMGIDRVLMVISEINDIQKLLF